MKWMLALLLLSAVVLGYIAWTAPEPDYVAPRAVPRQLESAPATGEVVRAFDVDGMCCDGCSVKLFAAVLEQPGVREAAIRVEEGRLEAICAAETDAESLARALTFEKYTVRSNP